MSSPLINSPALTAGEPTPQVPVAVGGKPQPVSGTRTVRVKGGKAHDRVIKVKAPKVTAPKAAPTPADPYAAPINSAVNLKFGPQVQAADQGIVNAKYNQIRTQNWYQAYQQQLQNEAAQQNQAAVALAHALTQYNPQAADSSPLAQQAQASEKALGQSFAGTQSQMALNTANQFATGLIPGAALRGADTAQQFGNQIGQLQQQKGNLLGQEGDYRTQLRGQMEAQAAKDAQAQQKIQLAAQALGITASNTQSEIGNRTANQQVARSNVRIKRSAQAQTKQQNAVNNAIKVNQLALKAYQLAHPNLRSASGTTIAQKYQQGVDRGAAILRLLHSTPPTKANGQVTKPNPFYNLNYGDLSAHKQDFIDMLQTSSKAGHLTKEQATSAVNAFLKQAKGNTGDLGTLVTGLLNKLSSKK